MGATFQVKSFEVALNVMAWIMIIMAATQTLDSVNMSLKPCTAAGRTSYKIPKKNISTTPAFFIQGRRSRTTLTTGRERMQMSIMTWTKRVPKKNFESLMVQVPLGIEASQKYAIGTQWKMLRNNYL